MKIIKQAVFVLLGVTAVVFLVLGSMQNKSEAPPGFTVVEYWEKWNNPEAAQMEVIVDDFNKSVGREKKIFVHFLSVSDIDQKTLISISAGVPPDITGTWDTQIAQYAALGAVQQLDELAAAHGITEDYYLPVFWRGCCYNGHLYALVSTPGTVALLYNKQIYQECGDKLRAAGLDPNRAPRTLDEFDKYAAIMDTPRRVRADPARRVTCRCKAGTSLNCRSGLEGSFRSRDRPDRRWIHRRRSTLISGFKATRKSSARAP